MTPERKAKLIVWLNAATLVGGAVTVFLLFRIISNAASQNTNTNKQIIASQKLTETELRCLAAFFSQTNRQNLRINNLESCQILHTDTGQTEELPLTPTSNNTQSSPAVPSSDTKQNSTTTATPTQPNQATSQGQSNKSDTSQTNGNSQTAPQVQAQAAVGTPAGDAAANVGLQLQPAAGLDNLENVKIEVRPPKKLLGVALCVPFTKVCVR